MPDHNRSPIFVVGSGRSGSTLLQLMMSAHPRIFIAFETAFYMWQGLYPRKAPRRDFLEHYFRTPHFRWLGVDPAKVRAALPDPLPPERTGEALDVIMREAAALRGRVRYGDKTPYHALNLREIFADFPDARVIQLTRDPRATAMSQARMPWCPPTLWAGAWFCDVTEKWAAKYRDRMLSIRFEDLIAEPRATMARVLEYVGEPWDDAVLDHSRHLPPNIIPPYPWIESAAGERRPGAPGWKSLTPLEIRMVEMVAGHVMRGHGYAPAEVEREPSRIAVYWAAIRQLPATIAGLVRAQRLKKIQSDPRSFDDGRFVAAFRTINPASWGRWPDYTYALPPAPGRALPEPR